MNPKNKELKFHLRNKGNGVAIHVNPVIEPLPSGTKPDVLENEISISEKTFATIIIHGTEPSEVNKIKFLYQNMKRENFESETFAVVSIRQ